MASGFFAILDDIAALMDDVAVASKIATKKTAGILGDDLAVNAEKATGFVSSRELPVLWAITKGSFINKLIIIPIALLLSYFFPVAIKFVLVLGACYLAYEGVEKILHSIFHRNKPSETVAEKNTVDISTEEKTKIRSAITTDFILSVEIVIISLGTVLDKSISLQILTVTVVSIIATVGVYGIVALIVRMDDAGFSLIKKSNDKGLFGWLGNSLVKLLPLVIRLLGIVGTLALLLVAGGIFVHNIDALHHYLPSIPSIINEFAIGILVGLIVWLIVISVQKIVGRFKK